MTKPLLAQLVKRTVFAVTAIAVCGIRLVNAEQPSTNDLAVKEEQEPPERFTITIGDQTLLLELDVERHMKIGGERKSVRIKKHSVRTLQVRHMSFDYPSYFYFDKKVAESIDQFSKWELKGRSVKLNLQRMTKSLSFADYIAGMREELASADVTSKISEPKTIVENFGGNKVHGIRFDILVAGNAQISVEYLDLLETEDGSRYVLVFAYDPGDGIEESRIVRRLLRRSVKFAPSEATRE